MATNNLEHRWSFSTLITHGESNDRRLISSEEVRFAWLKIPCINLFNLCEVVSSKKVLHVLDAVEVGGGCFQALEDGF